MKSEEDGSRHAACPAEFFNDYAKPRLSSTMIPWLSSQGLPYRQAIRATGIGEQKVIRRVRGGHEYAHLKLSIEPLARGKGYEFSEQVTARDSLPRKFLSCIEIGVLKAAESGLWGFPLTDFHVCVLDGSYHDVDSTAAAFKDVAKTALFEAMLASHPVILDPWVSLTVRVPEEYLGSVMSDLNERRGLLEAMRLTPKPEIAGVLPQSETADYLTSLASLTAGSGICSLGPSEFKELPDSLTLHCYCAVCKRDMLIPLVRGKPFTEECFDLWYSL